ncbi:CPm [Bean yellow disorder virus]|uniref:CPm n=1 Tax=Bean yellow disorder virus TaxID=267970 RepID=B2BZX1_9CLOS|nr:CPm [Bean yellow disorder virus]ABY66970.1 CPm [Bean yellow disorder virus]
MEAGDLYEEIDGVVYSRNEAKLWCQSHTLNIQNVQVMRLEYLHSLALSQTKFVLQIKFIVNTGNLIYEFKFNDPSSHKFKETGGRFWSSAFESLGNARAFRVGALCSIDLVKEGSNWNLSLNGFKYVKIKGTFNPSDLIISLAHPGDGIDVDRFNVYKTNFVRFKSLFNTFLVNNENHQPSKIHTYILMMNTDQLISMKLRDAVDITSIKTEKDFNVSLEKDENKEKPDKKPSEEVKPQPKPSPQPQPKPVPVDENSNKKNDPGNNIEKTGEEAKIPVVETEPNIPVNITEKRSNVKSKLKRIEKYRLFSTEIERIFEECKSYYIKLGFDSIQAELIIFQFGVTFCTSKNAIGDLTSHLIWENDKGENIRLKKSDHVRLLNSLTKTVCNVERLMLRYYSPKILTLLKEGALVPGWYHANKRGFKPEYAYLACDFYDPSKLRLSEQELQAINSDQNYVLLKNKHRRSIVNVNQLY